MQAWCFAKDAFSLFQVFIGVIGNPAQFSKRSGVFKTAPFGVEYRPTPCSMDFAISIWKVG